MTVTETSRDDGLIAPHALVAPWWRRARLWLALAGVVLLGAVALALASAAPGRPLDPDSAGHSGSRALARLLQQRGTIVHRTTTLDGIPAAATVVVAFPDSYSRGQLLTLAGDGRRLVLPASNVALGVLAPQLTARSVDGQDSTVAPGCDVAGARAAGDVRFPAGTTVFAGADCYGGRVYLTSSLVLLGPSSALANAHLAEPGVAALDLNVISDDGAVRNVTWLLPGADAHGQGSPSVWDLLPGWAPRAFVWLIVLAVLLMIWRSRRMGPVVFEPLPVVVRAAELVEGHGRLYRRAHARARATAALRQATLRRLARAYGLPAGHSLPDLVSAVSAATGRPTAWLYRVLAGQIPNDDPELEALARDLGQLDSDAAAHGKGAFS